MICSSDRDYCRQTNVSNIRTFNSEVQLIGDGLPLGVERGAGVAAAAVARHLLQHQALVAVEHPRARVVRQRPVL